MLKKSITAQNVIIYCSDVHSVIVVLLTAHLNISTTQIIYQLCFILVLDVKIASVQ